MSKGTAARVAAIDCGTNSLRLLVADVNPAAGTLTDVDRRMEIVRLGQGVDATGRLAPAALERTLQALRSYAAIVAAAGRWWAAGPCVSPGAAQESAVETAVEPQGGRSRAAWETDADALQGTQGGRAGAPEAR